MRRAITVADLFCGAGGTSAGAVEAIEAAGMHADLTAVNHWPVAIETHAANHPEARHYCTGIDAINPRLIFPDGLDVLWASPECTHHSIARGGKPINDQSRATAWCVVRWAEALMPGIILVENVPEFLTWGPIGSNGRPLASKKGATFAAWRSALQSLGYRVEHRILCAADYGDPTTRERLFVYAVRGKRRIIWPGATHTRTPDVGGLFGDTRRPWVPAREIIDWSLEGQSIFARKRPLSPKTMRRIEAGLRKFGLGPFIVPNYSEREGQSPRVHSVAAPVPTVTGNAAIARPFLVKLRGTSEAQLQQHSAASVDHPLPTITSGGGHVGLAKPFLVCMEHGGSVRSADRPMPTITTAKGGAIAVVNPFLVQVSHGNGTDQNGDVGRAKTLTEPLPTVCGARGDLALIEPALLPQHSAGALRPVSKPAPTITCDGAVALVEPFLVEYYGTGGSQSVGDPLNTVTTKDRHALILPEVVVEGQRYRLDIRFRMLQPHELAAAQGFPSHYKFTGNKTQQVKQIGNAVPRRLARALVAAALTQSADVTWLVEAEATATAAA